METNENTSDLQAVTMGNEISHDEAVKQSVGGGGNSGQFHKVLVDNDYSVPNIVFPEFNDKQEVASHSIGSKNDTDARELGEPEEDITKKISHEETNDLKVDDDGLFQSNPDDEDSLLEECKALISEAADRAVKRSISKSLKADTVTDLDAESVDENVERVEVVNQARKSVTLDVDTIVTPEIDVDNTSETGINIRDDVFEECQESINGTVTTEDVDGSTKDQDTGKGKIKKNSKSKSKKNNSVKVDKAESIPEKESSKIEKKRGSIFSNMFKFSKRKASSSDIVNEDNEQSPVKDSVTDKPSNGESIKIPNGVSEENTDGIRRLDSLDSGIVVEKVNVNQRVSVEYALPQKRKQDTGHEPSSDNHTETSQLELAVEAGAEHGSDIVGQRLAEPIYINGEKEDEDFVYINERAVDVADLSKSQCSIVEAVNAGPSGIAYDQVEKENREDADDEKESNISSDSGTGMASKVKMVDKPSKPNIVKLKKKSWSFQFGKKKTSENNEETKSNGSTEAEKETKKPRWKFGKFSFRRPQEVSASTPDLTNASIPEEAPEENETMDKKPRKLSRLRQLISKKSRKKSAASSDDGLERRSMSMMDIAIPDNTARSRRSIVEEEIDLPQTDAFDGVELSDLSQEEDGADDKNKKRREKKSKLAKSKHSVKDTGKPAHEAGEAKDNNQNNEADGITDSIQTDQVYANQTVEVSGVNEAPVVEDEYVNMVKEPSSPITKQINITLQMPKVPVIEDDNKTERPVDDSQANVEAEPDYAVLKEVMTEENQVITDTPVQNIIIEPPEDFVDPNEEVQETFVKEEAKRKEQAYSNLLYASTDFNSPTEPSNDTSAMESPDEDESDAFVQLQEIVNDQAEPDMSEITETFHVKDDDQRRQNRESFVSNMAEMFEPVKLASDNSLAHSSNLSEGLTNKVETRIVLMREIGVQAPDIYMPLDKEDFGFTDKKVTTCDIGVQVNTFENTVEDKVVTPKLVQETNETVNTDKDDSTAFF